MKLLTTVWLYLANFESGIRGKCNPLRFLLWPLYIVDWFRLCILERRSDYDHYPANYIKTYTHPPSSIAGNPISSTMHYSNFTSNPRTFESSPAVISTLSCEGDQSIALTGAVCDRRNNSCSGERISMTDTVCLFSMMYPMVWALMGFQARRRMEEWSRHWWITEYLSMQRISNSRIDPSLPHVRKMSIEEEEKEMSYTSDGWQCTLEMGCCMSISQIVQTESNVVDPMICVLKRFQSNAVTGEQRSGE